MPLAEFQTSRERIARVKEHRRTFSKLWAEFLDDDPFSCGVDVQDDGSGHVWVALQYDALPSVFSLSLGEMIYQLRAALDSCIYGCAIRDSGRDPPPDATGLEFPIRENSEQFKKAKRMIRPLAEERKKIIESLQPFNANRARAEEKWLNTFIGVLNDLARRDRHRRLQVVGSHVEADPKLKNPCGTRVTSWETRSHLFLSGRTWLAKFKLEGWTPGMDIRANANCVIDISIEESIPGFSGPYSLDHVVPNLIGAVEEVHRRLEESF